MYKTILGHRTYVFENLKILLAKATPTRSGDRLAGLTAETAEERASAKMALADVFLRDFTEDLLVPYEEDEVTRLIIDRWDREAFREISEHTVGSFRDFLLSEKADRNFFRRIRSALTPEMVSAVSKLMRNQDLVLVADKIEVVTRFRNTIGLKGRFSTRLQPNHPTDDPKGILASIVDGLYYGSGDAVIGINPATDNLGNVRSLVNLLEDFRLRTDIPTQTCILTHITNTIESIRLGDPVDLVFQSIAGTERANSSFGINLALLKEGYEAGLSLNRGTVGNHVMYFETGQGSALSANAHRGMDQQTCEVRAYSVAREFHPLLVNTVVGFIGPEYLYNGKEILRAGLEDHFCGKLMGLPMGVDICYTNHADADQDDMDTLLTMLGAAGCNFIMGIPGADDIMLNYQSTSFHDALYVRKLLGKKPAPEFEEWLETMGIYTEKSGLLPPPNLNPTQTHNRDKKPDPGLALLPEDMEPYCVGLNNIRNSEYTILDTDKPLSISKDPWRPLREFTRARIGLGRTGQTLPLRETLSFQLAHAQAKDAILKDLDPIEFTKQLYQDLSDSYPDLASFPVLKSQASDLDRYLLDPGSGRILARESEEILKTNVFPKIFIGITNGLSTQAIENHTAQFLQELFRTWDREILPELPALFYVHRGRVAITDSIGSAIQADLGVLLVGERPGLSSPDSLGVYLTYKPRLGMTDESRNCISNVRPEGLDYKTAARRLFYLITQSLEKKISGVELKDRSQLSDSSDQDTLGLAEKVTSLLSKPKVKICGVRDPETTSFAVSLGVDLLGINLSPVSKRRVDSVKAKELATIIRKANEIYSQDTKIVLLFFQNEPEEALDIARQIRPDMVQLIYGDPKLTEYWDAFRKIFPILPVFSAGENLEDESLPFPEIPILDTPSGKQGGGTGTVFPWERVRGLGRNYFLAGGLNPENVERAVSFLRPYGVDVASGVEDEEGNQSKSKIQDFLRNAKR